MCDPEQSKPPVCYMTGPHSIATGNGWQPASVSRKEFDTQGIKQEPDRHRKRNGKRVSEGTKEEVIRK